MTNYMVVVKTVSGSETREFISLNQAKDFWSQLHGLSRSRGDILSCELLSLSGERVMTFLRFNYNVT